MSGAVLKLLALVFMICDHTAMVFPAVPRPLYIVLRGLGGMAFPIFCFLLTEGFVHTHSRRAYLMRLAAFALISEIPFDLAIYGKTFDFGHQNVFFTLLVGLLMLLALERAPIWSAYAWTAVIAVGCFAAAIIRSDYSWLGISLIAAMYLLRDRPSRRIWAGGALAFAGRLTAPFAFLLIHMYNGERGRQQRLLFYWMYPVHLLVLGLIRMNL